MRTTRSVPTSRSGLLRLGILSALILAPSALAQFVEGDAQAMLSIPGLQKQSIFGFLVDPMGDVNGDGVVDFAASAPFHGNSGGRISVHSGIDGKEIWSARNTKTSAVLGFSLESVQDLDGDAVRDLLSSAVFDGGGKASLYSGASGTVITTFLGAGGDELGYSVAGDGDFDGDGTLDIALGAPGDDTTGADEGRVYVYSGVSLQLIAAIDQPLAGEAELGAGLGFLADVNGDGRDDLAVGSRKVLFGNDGRVHVFTFDGSTPALLYSIDNVGMGSAIGGDKLEGGGDVDGDGIGDLYLGDYFASTAWIFSGADGSIIHAFTAGVGDDLGSSAAGIVADQNGDGRADVLVGAWGDPTGGDSTGKVTLFSGATGAALRTFTYLGVDHSAFGADVDLLGDLNGDGKPEILVGASGNNFFQVQGHVFVMSGEPCHADSQSYGTGVAGTLGIPAIALQPAPVMGAASTFSLGNSRGVTTPGVLFAGLQPAAIPGFWGGNLWLVPMLVVPVLIPANGIAQSITIGIDTRLCGFDVFLQALEIDPGASQGISSTTGLHVVIGV